MTRYVYEEYDWLEVADFMKSNVTAVFCAPPLTERSKYLSRQWEDSALVFEVSQAENDNSQVAISVRQGGRFVEKDLSVPTVDLSEFLRRYSEHLRCVCLDISGMAHWVLMFLTSLALQKDTGIVRLFAAYAVPNDYERVNDRSEYALSEQFLGLQAVPGFQRRQRDLGTDITAFLGYEGGRLLQVIEGIGEARRVRPVISFPSIHPMAHIEALKTCMGAITTAGAISDIHKCQFDSVFEAYEIAQRHYNLAKGNAGYAIAPLGTRAHSLATAIFAARHRKVRILYDYPVESAGRSTGVEKCRVYHLTTFLDSP